MLLKLTDDCCDGLGAWLQMLLVVLVDADSEGFCFGPLGCFGILKSALDPALSSKIARIGPSDSPCLDPSFNTAELSRAWLKVPHDAPKALPLGWLNRL